MPKEYINPPPSLFRSRDYGFSQAVAAKGTRTLSSPAKPATTWIGVASLADPGVPRSAPVGRLLSRSSTRSSGMPPRMRSRRFRRLRAQGKESLDERGAALGGLLNLPSLFQGRAVFLEAHHEKIGAAED